MLSPRVRERFDRVAESRTRTSFYAMSHGWIAPVFTTTMMSEEAGHAGQADRFLQWLTTTAEERGRAEDDDRLSLVELAELACAYADRAFERAGGPQRAEASDCRRGCDYCCNLPVETCRAEATRALEFARKTLNAAEFRELKHRIREAAACYPLPPERPPAQNPPCPLLKDSACLVYEVRPLACRGWNSNDAAACRAAYERGVNKVTVPVDTRIRGVYANASEALLRGLTRTRRDGPTHLVPALAALIVLEDA
jgi:Fe-S-cluster containining protein